MILLFGFGLSLDVKNLPLVFADHDRSPYSREYIDGYVHSEYFNLHRGRRPTRRRWNAGCVPAGRGSSSTSRPTLAGASPAASR